MTSLVAIAATALSSCGAGMVDSSTPIVGEYRYVETGGNGRYVSRFQEGVGETIVIGARVDKVEINGNRILVARRPKTSTEHPQGGYEDHLANVCEYWFIDVQTHRKGTFDPGAKWPTLKCVMTG